MNSQDGRSSFFAKLKSPMYVHIAVEVVCLLLIVGYVRRSTQRLQDQVRELSQVVQQQQEMLHMHQQILGQYGWYRGTDRGNGTSSSTSTAPPPRPSAPSPLDVDVNDLPKIFHIPFSSSEEVVILPHPSLAEHQLPSASTATDTYPSQTVIPPKDEVVTSALPSSSSASSASASSSIDEEIADEIQELLEEEKRHHQQEPTTPVVGAGKVQGEDEEDGSTAPPPSLVSFKEEEEEEEATDEENAEGS